MSHTSIPSGLGSALTAETMVRYWLPLLSFSRLVLCGLMLFGLVLLMFGAGSRSAWASGIEVLPGYQLEKIAEVPGARQMVLSAAGHLYVGSRREGKVHVVEDFVRGGRDARVILTGVEMPSGVAMDRQGDLLVSAVNEIWMLTNADQALDSIAELSAAPSSATALMRHWKLLTNELPSHGHHGWKAIELSPDQSQLIVPVGAPCNICLVYPQVKEPTGTLLAVDVRQLKAGQLDYDIIAQGVRNSVGMAFHPLTQQLWFSDNGRDWMGDDMPPCEINRIAAGSVGMAHREQPPHFGFPFVHGNPRRGGIVEPQADIARYRSAATAYVSPVFEIQAHSAPLGIHFYQGRDASLKGRLLVAEHGSWNRSSPVGYRVSGYPLQQAQLQQYKPQQSEPQQPQRQYADEAPLILVNFLDSDGNKLGRPVDLIEMQDGALLISDDANGVVWRLSKAPAPAN